VTASLHLVREALGTTEVQLDARTEHERATAASPLDPPLPSELRQRPPHRDEAAAVATGQLPLGRQAVARPPLAVVQGAEQVEVDLVMEGNGTELETVASQRSVLLRALRLMITL
jgi:hypothetical protein